MNYYRDVAIDMATAAKNLSLKAEYLYNSMDNINPNTELQFFAEEIKIYGSGFDNLLQSTDYKIFDYFASLNSINQEVLYYTSHINANAFSNARFNYSNQFLSANLHNDFLIKVKGLTSSISGEIESKTTTIENLSMNIILLIGVLFAFDAIITSFMTYNAYRKICQFFVSLFGVSYSEDIAHQLDALKQFRTCLESESFEDYLNGRLQAASHRQNSQRYSTAGLQVHNGTQTGNTPSMNKKFVQTTKIAWSYLFRYLGLAVFMGASFGIMFVCNDRFKKGLVNVLPYYNDMIQAASLSSQIQILFIDFLKFNTGNLIRYQDPIIAFENDSAELARMMSISNNHFTLEFQQRLSRDFCNLTTLTNCTTIQNGIATNGILMVLYQQLTVL
jgi:hypothetical protein